MALELAITPPLLVIRLMEEIEISGDYVLEAGCGTGVLGIRPKRKGLGKSFLPTILTGPVQVPKRTSAGMAFIAAWFGGPEALMGPRQSST